MGCGSKENVSLSAQLENASVAVATVALGSELSGGFDLRLELGEHAPEPTDVSLGTFSLRREQTELLSSLPLATPTGVSFPLRVAPGEVKSVRLSIDSNELLEQAQADAICQGPLIVAGAVIDTLGGGTTNAFSQSVTPDCPVD